MESPRDKPLVSPRLRKHSISFQKDGVTVLVSPRHGTVFKTSAEHPDDDDSHHVDKLAARLSPRSPRGADKSAGKAFVANASNKRGAGGARSRPDATKLNNANAKAGGGKARDKAVRAAKTVASPASTPSSTPKRTGSEASRPLFSADSPSSSKWRPVKSSAVSPNGASLASSPPSSEERNAGRAQRAQNWRATVPRPATEFGGDDHDAPHGGGGGGGGGGAGRRNGNGRYGRNAGYKNHRNAGGNGNGNGNGGAGTDKKGSSGARGKFGHTVSAPVLGSKWRRANQLGGSSEGNTPASSTGAYGARRKELSPSTSSRSLSSPRASRSVRLPPDLYADKAIDESGADTTLPDSWQLWYESSPPRGTDSETFKDTLKVVGGIQTLAAAWNFVLKLSDCMFVVPNYSNLRLFRAFIRPMWEDEWNQRGGKFVLQCRKEHSLHVFMCAMLPVLTERLSFAAEVCGLCLHVRSVGDTVQIWVRSAETFEANRQSWLRELRGALDLKKSFGVKLVFHTHRASVTYNREFIQQSPSSTAVGFYSKVQERRSKWGRSIAEATDNELAVEVQPRSSSCREIVADKSDKSASSGAPPPEPQSGAAAVDERTALRRILEEGGDEFADDESETGDAHGESSGAFEAAGAAAVAPTSTLSPLHASHDGGDSKTRPPATLAGRFFGTIHAPATHHKLKSLLHYDIIPLPEKKTPRGSNHSDVSPDECGDADSSSAAKSMCAAHDHANGGVNQCTGCIGELDTQHSTELAAAFLKQARDFAEQLSRRNHENAAAPE